MRSSGSRSLDDDEVSGVGADDYDNDEDGDGDDDGDGDVMIVAGIFAQM